MYDAASGIEVYVRPYREDNNNSEGQYAEYEAPRGTPFYTGNPRERYIEAVTDERYEIVTILHPESSFKGNQCVKISQTIDDCLHPTGYVDAKQKQPKIAFTDITSCSPTGVDGIYQLVGYLFGAVSASEDVDLSIEEETSERKKRGCIIAEVRRGKMKEVPRNRKPRENKAFLTEQTSKRVAMQFGKSHSLKPVLLGQTEVATLRRVFTPATGKAGETVKFTFYYTSRMHLERNGILPETSTTADRVQLSASKASNQSIDVESSSHEAAASNLRTTDVCKDRDDEEIEPLVKIKTEPTEDLAVLTSSASASNETKRIQPTQIINLLDSDDEAPLPKKIKVETVEDTKSSQLTNVLLNTIADAAPHASVKIESQGGGGEPEVSNVLRSDEKQTKKSKKKSRLMLELEEIRIKKELQALEDEEED